MTAGVDPAPPTSVVALGAGTMGAGIALVFAAAGSRVAMVSRSEETLGRAGRRIRTSLDRLIGAGVLGPGEREEAIDRIAPVTAFQEVDFAVDLVVESIAEVLQDKASILRSAEERAAPHTILCTNTSSLPLAELSKSLRRPESFVGYHWFNPAELVPLVEIVPAPRTSSSALDRVEAWSRAVGKEPVRLAQDVEGFVANRLQYALMREAYALLERGACTAADVDRVVTAGLGPRWAAVGPFETMDLAGLDVHRVVLERLFPRLANDRGVPRALRDLVDGGALGVKAGRGLRGTYAEGRLGRLEERRAGVLLALEGLRRGT